MYNIYILPVHRCVYVNICTQWCETIEAEEDKLFSKPKQCNSTD